jgi:hypothetical protein
MTFLTKNWRGLAVFGLGALTLVLAATVLHVCADEGHFMTMQNGMQANMACTWTKRAVMGIGGLVAIAGLLMMWWHQAEQALSLLSLAAGALIIAMPLWIIPTCANQMMTCNMSFKPGALVLGGLIALMGAVGAIKFARGERMVAAA